MSGQSILQARHFAWLRKATDNGRYETLKVTAGLGSAQRHIEVTVSPAGRSVHIHIDGVEVR